MRLELGQDKKDLDLCFGIPENAKDLICFGYLMKRTLPYDHVLDFSAYRN